MRFGVPPFPERVDGCRRIPTPTHPPHPTRLRSTLDKSGVVDDTRNPLKANPNISTLVVSDVNFICVISMKLNDVEN